MAGKKKKKDQSGAGEKGFKLPKTIAGVKIPKDIRGSLVDLAKHPIVADLLAAGLVALAARVKDQPVVRKGTAKAGDAAHDLADAAGAAVAAVLKPVVERTRRRVAEPPATSTAPAARRTRKPADAPASEASNRPARARGAAGTASAQPAKRTRKAATDSDAAKPRASRRTPSKAPAKPPQTDA